MLATTVGLTLRIVGDDLRRQLMAELRKNVRASAESFTDSERADTLALEMEERADQLLDQIERLATIETPTPPAPRG
jgi:hypothetical protein